MTKKQSLQRAYERAIDEGAEEFVFLGQQYVTADLNALFRPTEAEAKVKSPPDPLVQAAVSAVRAGHAESFAYAIGLLNDDSRRWAAFMRAVAKVPCPSDEVRKRFLKFWLAIPTASAKKSGTIWSSAMGCGRCCPRYAGPALRLYRGDSALNRRRRTYGLSWSADRAKAREFAEDGGDSGVPL